VWIGGAYGAFDGFAMMPRAFITARMSITTSIASVVPLVLLNALKSSLRQNRV
jgi:hypothetical protein